MAGDSSANGLSAGNDLSGACPAMILHSALRGPRARLIGTLDNGIAQPLCVEIPSRQADGIIAINWVEEFTATATALFCRVRETHRNLEKKVVRFTHLRFLPIPFQRQADAVGVDAAVGINSIISGTDPNSK